MARALEPHPPLFMENLCRARTCWNSASWRRRPPYPSPPARGSFRVTNSGPDQKRKGVSIVQPDVAKCGGISEIRKIANLAEVYGVQVAPHQCYGPIAHVASLASMAACRNFLIQEWEAGDRRGLPASVQRYLPGAEDGVTALPERPSRFRSRSRSSKRHPFTHLSDKARIPF